MQGRRRRTAREIDPARLRHISRGKKLEHHRRTLLGREGAVGPVFENREFEGHRPEAHDLPDAAIGRARHDELVLAAEPIECDAEFPAEHELEAADRRRPSALPGNQPAVGGGDGNIRVGVRIEQV
ncbi:hypothetical protein D9M68_811690 [compost metagenome]